MCAKPHREIERERGRERDSEEQSQNQHGGQLLMYAKELTLEQVLGKSLNIR